MKTRVTATVTYEFEGQTPDEAAWSMINVLGAGFFKPYDFKISATDGLRLVTGNAVDGFELTD